MRFKLEIEGAPPKKDGANSMWRKPSEFERLKALRVAAAAAVAEVGDPPATGDIQLSLEVYAPPEAGDLDTFITGICDGLMVAHPRTPIDPALWLALPEAARPDRPLLFSNDARVTQIHAERRPSGSSRMRYTLEVNFLT